ncbi:unnamed protein product, partial [Staurois parvus]
MSYDVLSFSPRMRGSESAQLGVQRCTVSLGHSGSPIHGKSRRCWLGHVISCVQSQLITDDQCALMISVVPAVPPVSVHQCQLSVHINATYLCPSELPFSVTHQCQSVSPINANQCDLTVPYISAAFQCPSVMPVNAHQCHLSVPPHQCPSL